MQHLKEEKVTESRSEPTLKEGTQRRIMLRDLTKFNNGESRNQRTILPGVAKIGICYPSKRRKGNLM